MFVEFIEMFFTPATKVAKKYGFLYHSISLRHRYERCKKAWLPHLKNCQEIFEEVAENLPQKKSVVILGAAHLHEIPYHLLTKHFEKIILVDIVHPLKHHRLSKRNPHFELITMDLGHSLEQLESLQSMQALDTHLRELESKVLFHFKADLIISANILSQLGLLPIEAIERYEKRKMSIEEKDSICTRYAELHLKNLRNCSGTVLVYSDREVTYKSPEKEVVYTGSYPVNFDGFTKLRDWTWELAPLKEASKDYSIEMQVEAYLHTN